MANPTFKVEISAVDHATAIVRKINASMDKMLAPITRTQASVSAFKKAVSDNVVVKGLAKVGNVAKDVAEKVGSIIAPMAAVVGIGSIGGVIALATEWGKLGFQITNAANAIGISAGDLQLLRGAAGMAGVSVGELDGGLKAIGDTWQNAQFGRNQDALMMMNRLGISVHRLKDGSVDAARGLMDISKAIQGKNVEVQRLIANSFGVGSLLPMLQKGPEAIEAFQKKYEALAGVMSGPALTAASQFQEQVILLHASVDGLKNRIGEKLIPILSPLISQFTSWIAANKDLIATKVGEWVQNISGWIKEMYASFKAGEFDGTIKDLKSVAIAIGDIGAGIGRAIVLWDKWTNKKTTTPEVSSWGPIRFGKKDALDAGDRANSMSVARESGGKIKYPVSAAPGVPAIPAVAAAPGVPLGIRSNNPLNMMPGGREAVYESPEVGIGAAVANLRKNYAGLSLAGIVNKWSPPNASGNSALKNANYLGGLSKETGIAPDQAPDLDNAALVSRLVKAQIRQENGQQPYSDSQVNAGVEKGMQQEVHVKVTLGNAPAGTTASAKDGAGAMMPIRVAYSMPTTVTP